MKAADYRIPWGRPSERLLAVKREITGQQMHVKRVHDARNRRIIDNERPECAQMPHLIARPKKKQMQEDRQREIAAENYSLMHRLAGIMREERENPVQRYSHLSVEYRESLRRKKLLKLETENRRLAGSIKKQKPSYSTQAMEKAEQERQALLKTMSRTQRRKHRAALFAAVSRSLDGDPGGISLSIKSSGGGSYDSANADSLVEDGVLFRPGPTAVKLRTARQMQMEVAQRYGVGGGGFDHDSSPDDGYGNEATVRGGGIRVGGGGGALTPINSTRERAVGIVLDINRTGGSMRRAGTTGDGGGRPNIIFTPSLVPVGMGSERMNPKSLGPCVGREVDREGGIIGVRSDTGGVDVNVVDEGADRSGGGSGKEDGANGVVAASRDTRTV